MQNAAFRFGVICAILFLVHSVPLASEKEIRRGLQEKIHSKTQRQESQADGPRMAELGVEPRRQDIVPQNQTGKPKEHKNPCDSPANREEDDTCSQFRSANATQEQADWGLYGILVGGISAMATAVAAWAAAAAAKASKEAVIAAKSQVEFAEKTLVGNEAPFLFPIVDFPEIERAQPGTLVVGYRQAARYKFKNFGRSPAVIREVYVAFPSGDALPIPVPFPPMQTPLLFNEIVGVNETGAARETPFQRVSRDGRSWKIVETDKRFVLGQVRYADVFGNQFISGFCYALNSKFGYFYAIGGSTHNYRSKLNEKDTREAESRDMLTPRAGEVG